MADIAEQIDTSLATVSDWTDGTFLPFIGMMFKQCDGSALDTAITAAEGASQWRYVCYLKRRAELNDYSSATIDAKTKATLTDMPMFANFAVPNPLDDDWFYPEQACMLHCYRWAQEYNHETAKWDAQDGFDGLQIVRDNETEWYYRCNVDTEAVTQMYDGRSQYGSLWANVWMMFEDLGVTVPRTYVTDEWDYLNSATYWNTDHYDYAKSWASWEFCAPTHFRIYAKYYVRKNRVITHFTDHLLTDMQGRYLTDKWESPQWRIGAGSTYYVTVHHNPDNGQRRLCGTLEAWKTLHMYYSKLDATHQANMQDMLLGTSVTKVSDGLLSATAGLFDSGTDRFKAANDGALSDSATTYGCLVLFLSAITPITGSLAIPIYCDNMWVFDYNEYNTEHFMFDYDNRAIKIPVFNGKFTFTFGSQAVDYTFERSGVYMVYFSDDWNTILKVVQTSELPGEYLDYPVVEGQHWSDLKHAFSSHNMTVNVIRRKLYLEKIRDSTTGWPQKGYRENMVEATVTPLTTITEHNRLGLFTAKQFQIQTASQITDGDQIIFQDRCYEVSQTEEINKGSTFECYRATITELPLFMET